MSATCFQRWLHRLVQPQYQFEYLQYHPQLFVYQLVWLGKMSMVYFMNKSQVWQSLPNLINEPLWLDATFVTTANQWSQVSVCCGPSFQLSACVMRGEVTPILNGGSHKLAAKCNAKWHWYSVSLSSTVGLIIPLARTMSCLSFITAARLLECTVSTGCLPGEVGDFCVEFGLGGDYITTCCICDVPGTAALLEPWWTSGPLVWLCVVGLFIGS